MIASEIETCGVTMGQRAFCWGHNNTAQLGDGTTTSRATPVAVLGGLQFRQVSPGGNHACALTPGDRAYCWGYNANGQIGDGTTTLRRTPVAVH